MAAKLDDATIAGLAAFYAAKPAAAGTAGDAGDISAGKAIYTDGIAAADVPACAACHGDKAEGNGAIPRLAGQQRGYLERQLAAFASNARANETMHDNSKSLTTAQIDQVAGFLAAQ